MKIKYAVLSILFLINSAFAQGLSSEKFIKNLRDKGEISLFDSPAVDIFSSECSNIIQKPLLGDELEFMCQIVTSSNACKDLEKEDLLNCKNYNDSKEFDAIDFFAGCTTGFFDSISELLSFIWSTLKWVWDKGSSYSNSYRESSEYIDSVKLYLINEYDQAFDDANDPFRKVKAAKGVASAIGKKLFSEMQKYLYNEYRSFGCMNFKARTRIMCKVAVEFLLPPLSAFALLKRGALGFRGSKKLKKFLAGKKYKNDLLKRKKLGESNLGRALNQKEVDALERSHLVGKGQAGKDGNSASIGNYTEKQLRDKVKILKNAGFSSNEIRSLVEGGVVGISSLRFGKVIKKLFGNDTSSKIPPKKTNTVVDRSSNSTNQAKISNKNQESIEDVNQFNSSGRIVVNDGDSITVDSLAVDEGSSININITGGNANIGNISMGDNVNISNVKKTNKKKKNKKPKKDSSSNTGIVSNGGSLNVGTITVDGKKINPGTYKKINTGDKKSSNTNAGIVIKGPGSIKVGK